MRGLLADKNIEGHQARIVNILESSWSPGKLPVLTLANKRRFERDADYRKLISEEVAELLFNILVGDSRDCDRIYVPR